MQHTRRRFLQAAGLLTAGAMMPELRAERSPHDLGTATGINPFAFDLHAKLRSTKGNIFVSPFSISSALAMTAGGAQGNTLSQMAKALRFVGTKEDPVGHAKFSELMFTLAGPQKRLRPFTLDIANGIWAQNGYPWKKEFQQLVSGKYLAELRDVDFKGDSEKQRLAINKWVEEITKDKIKELFALGIIDPLTRMVLVNAIYYKGTWEKPFPKYATKDAPFHLADGTKQDSPMMNLRTRAKLTENAEVQVLELPYSSSQTSMTIVLPRKIDGLSALEAKLDHGKWTEWMTGAKSEDVIVSLPKFKVESSFGLNDTLKAMGMIDAFDFDKADFGGMVTSMPEGPLAITAVVHKAYCDVNEEGTEAAAATGVVIGLRSAAPRPMEPKVFKADHPFLFAIRHNPTNTILFLGRVNNPKG